MTRAFQVFFGVMLIGAVWAWMLLSSADLEGVWGLVLLACKACTAGFISAPIYREYLR